MRLSLALIIVVFLSQNNGFAYEHCESEYIDGCHFVVCVGGAGRSISTVHHPNCKNPIHVQGPVPTENFNFTKEEFLEMTKQSKKDWK